MKKEPKQKTKQEASAAEPKHKKNTSILITIGNALIFILFDYLITPLLCQENHAKDNEQQDKNTTLILTIVFAAMMRLSLYCHDIIYSDNHCMKNKPLPTKDKPQPEQKAGKTQETQETQKKEEHQIRNSIIFSILKDYGIGIIIIKPLMLLTQTLINHKNQNNYSYLIRLALCSIFRELFPKYALIDQNKIKQELEAKKAASNAASAAINAAAVANKQSILADNKIGKLIEKNLYEQKEQNRLIKNYQQNANKIKAQRACAKAAEQAADAEQCAQKAVAEADSAIIQALKRQQQTDEQIESTRLDDRDKQRKAATERIALRQTHQQLSEKRLIRNLKLIITTAAENYFTPHIAGSATKKPGEELTSLNPRELPTNGSDIDLILTPTALFTKGSEEEILKQIQENIETSDIPILQIANLPQILSIQIIIMACKIDLAFYKCIPETIAFTSYGITIEENDILSEDKKRIIRSAESPSDLRRALRAIIFNPLFDIPSAINKIEKQWNQEKPRKKALEMLLYSCTNTEDIQNVTEKLQELDRQQTKANLEKLDQSNQQITSILHWLKLSLTNKNKQNNASKKTECWQRYLAELQIEKTNTKEATNHAATEDALWYQQILDNAKPAQTDNEEDATIDCLNRKLDEIIDKELPIYKKQLYVGMIKKVIMNNKRVRADLGFMEKAEINLPIAEKQIKEAKAEEKNRGQQQKAVAATHTHPTMTPGSM